MFRIAGLEAVGCRAVRFAATGFRASGLDECRINLLTACDDI
jgi:hypothetical protein